MEKKITFDSTIIVSFFILKIISVKESIKKSLSSKYEMNFIRHIPYFILTLALVSCGKSEKDFISGYTNDIETIGINNTYKKYSQRQKEDRNSYRHNELKSKYRLDLFVSTDSLQIVGDITFQNILIQIFDTTEYRYSNYKISCISEKDRYILYKVSKLNHTWHGDSLVKMIVHTQRFDSLKKIFKAVFGTQLDTSLLFSQKHIHGFHCGIAGKNPPTRDTLNKYLELNDHKSIRQWLNSSNLVLQTYAAEGIDSLVKKGYSPTNYEQQLIAIIKNRNGYIESCNGCIVDRNSIKKIFK